MRSDAVADNANSSTPSSSERDRESDEETSGEESGEHGPIVLTEIHYHPERDDESEFIELTNAGTTDVELEGWCIDGIDHCFDSQTLAPGEFVVTEDFDGSLDNGGEQITVLGPDGRVRDQLDYDDRGIWPAIADGHGASLQRRDVATGHGGPGNWSATTPSPGVANPDAGPVMPVVELDDASRTAVPADAPIEITASVSGTGDRAWIDYRVDVENAQRIDARIDDGLVVATLPAQPAGSLVRFRMSVSDASGTVGSAPRADSGREYDGVVVEPSLTAPATALPVIQWFVDDSVFETAENDLSLTGDDGYPVVLVADGVVFDGALLRIKGETSRFHPKKKWKVVLPPGMRTDIGGRLDEPVDEFALHSSWVDRSFVREPLAAEILQAAGVPHPEIFPVQVERNGTFFGLYHLVEEADGTWRDRFGFDDDAVYQVDAQPFDARLPLSNAELPVEEFRAIYDKRTRTDENDDELRELIVALNAPTLEERVAVIHRDVDVPAVVNMMAANALIQHNDYGQKNYLLIHDRFGRWTVAPVDFDLTFGRMFQHGDDGCGTTCDEVRVTGLELERLSGPLFGTFLRDPGLRALVARRLRELLPVAFDVETVIDRVETLSSEISTEAQLDRDVWGTWSPETPGDAARRLIAEFVIPHGDALGSTMVEQGFVAAEAQPAAPSIEFDGDVVLDTDGDDVSQWSVVNRDSVAVDLSGHRVDEIEFVVPGGTVLAPGERLLVVHDTVDSIPDERSRLGSDFRTARIVVMEHELSDTAADELTWSTPSDRVLARSALR